MVANTFVPDVYGPETEQEIHKLRYRVNWRGKLILQIQRVVRRQKNQPLLSHAPNTNPWEYFGLTEFRDVDAKNKKELGEVTTLMEQTGKW